MIVAEESTGAAMQEAARAIADGALQQQRQLRGHAARIAVFSQAMLTLIHEGMEAQQSRNGRELLVEFVRGSDRAPMSCELLRAHRQHQAEIKMANRTVYRDYGLVFAKETSDVRRKRQLLGDPLQANNLGQREYATLIKAAAVRPIKFHGLRHTCATLLLRAGSP